MISKLAGALLSASILATAAASVLLADTQLKVYISSQHQPQVWRKVLDQFEAANLGHEGSIETGKYPRQGAGSVPQHDHVREGLVSRRSPILDAFVCPAQFAAAGWTSPFEGKDMSAYLPAYAEEHG